MTKDHLLLEIVFAQRSTVRLTTNGYSLRKIYPVYFFCAFLFFSKISSLMVTFAFVCSSFKLYFFLPISHLFNTLVFFVNLSSYMFIYYKLKYLHLMQVSMTMNISADLQSLFTWNTKQVYQLRHS